jgi:hypothetical protein
MDSKLILQVDIPHFVTRVKISEARRPKYYEQNSSKKVPKKYSGSKYGYIPLKKGKRIIKVIGEISTGIPILANPKVSGTPKFMKIRGNDFYAGFGNPIIRSNVVRLIKESLSPYFRDMEPIDTEDYPLYIEFIYFDIEDKEQDLDNKRYAYEKCILDLLQKEGKILNDNVGFITKLSSEYIAVENEDERCLIVKFWSNHGK